MDEFKDRHSDEEIYAKTAVFDNMDKDSAKALKDEIKSDLISDTVKLKEELREDVGEIIDIIKSSGFTEEGKEVLIAKERDHLNTNLEEANKVCDDRLWSLDDS
jgi:site-specific DNA-adenine methylase